MNKIKQSKIDEIKAICGEAFSRYIAKYAQMMETDDEREEDRLLDEITQIGSEIATQHGQEIAHMVAGIAAYMQ